MPDLPKIAYPYDYSRIEFYVSSLVEQWKACEFDAIVAIARGGLAPAMMASTALSLPLYALAYARPSRKVSWFTAETPKPGARVLLVEDIAGRGTTLLDSRDFLLRQHYQVKVFTLAYDAQSRVVPDYGMKMPDNARAWFPWERESITAAFGQTDNMPDAPEYTYASWAIDMDGVLLADLPAHHYDKQLEKTLLARDALPPSAVLPQLDLASVTIITGRPEKDRTRTQAWLDRHGLRGRLVMRNEALHAPQDTAAHKAESIIAGGHTHYIESDAGQALCIANLVKVAHVYWWNDGAAMQVYANQLLAQSAFV